MQKILVYADTVPDLGEREDDNLAWLTITDKAFLEFAKANEIMDRKKWLNTYTADDTENLYDFLTQHEYEYLAEWEDGYHADLMFETQTNWCDDDIKDALEFYCIKPLQRNLRKVATKEFLKDFHESVVTYGNRLIQDKVSEVFKDGEF